MRASGGAATEFERVTCSYRSKLARFLQQVSFLHPHEGLVKPTPYSNLSRWRQAATHHDIRATFFEDPHVVYALFFYVVDPNKAVREAIASLIVR